MQNYVLTTFAFDRLYIICCENSWQSIPLTFRHLILVHSDKKIKSIIKKITYLKIKIN